LKKLSECQGYGTRSRRRSKPCIKESHWFNDLKDNTTINNSKDNKTSNNSNNIDNRDGTTDGEEKEYIESQKD
jgi:hypothetical protein